MDSAIAENNLCVANRKLQTAIILLAEGELSGFVKSANKLLTLDEQQRDSVLKQIKTRAQVQKHNEESTPGLISFLRETFKFPEAHYQALMGIETPECDKSCTQTYKDSIVDEFDAKAINIVLGVLSPTTKLKLLGPQSLKEGKLLGEGKDSVVYSLAGDANWVIKVLKLGGAERAELLEHYVNQLAADPHLKVAPVKSLGDGRLLQPFIDGAPKANLLWGDGVVAAQQLATEMTNKARSLLGIKEGQLYIEHPNIKIGVDPSYANFHFNEQGAYQGWIDAIYQIEQHAPKR